MARRSCMFAATLEMGTPWQVVSVEINEEGRPAVLGARASREHGSSRLSNGLCEATNSLMQATKRLARGTARRPR
jgi:hypothetical protein